jgi:hypothetical protein
LNKGEDELSSLDKHIHPSQSTEQFHQEQALSHMLMTEKPKKMVLIN